MPNNGCISHQPFNISFSKLGNFIDLKILEAPPEVVALIQNRAP